MSGIQFDVSLRVRMSDMDGWTEEQRRAFFNGIADVTGQTAVRPADATAGARLEASGMGKPA